MSDRPTVWILGAGFSRSLGGPLLDDLLSMATREKLAARDTGLKSNPAFNQVYALYHFGRNFSEGYLFEPSFPKLRGVWNWTDAEQFLETLSAAADVNLGQAHRDYLNRAWARIRPEIASKGTYGRHYLQMPGLTEENLDFSRVAEAARELVALQCGLFLDTRHTTPFDDHLAEVRSYERALPYVAWGDSLNEHDTILSFNYDTVVEDIACRKGINVFAVEEQEPAPALATLIKLHGSVDWAGTETGYRRQRGVIVRPPAIATPGNAKFEMSEGGFKPLWDEALLRLRQAEHIAWLGYSLPASDASAVKLVLEGLATNQHEGLTLDLVLGPTSFATDRIFNLIGGIVSPKRSRPAEQYLNALRKLEAKWFDEKDRLKEARRVVVGDTLVQPKEYAARKKQAFVDGFIRETERIKQVEVATESAADREASQVVKVLPLYAQDYLRLWATRRDQLIVHRRIADEIESAEQRVIELRKYIDGR